LFCHLSIRCTRTTQGLRASDRLHKNVNYYDTEITRR